MLLLVPLWKWKVEHGRRLRRWIEDGLVTVLGMGRDGKIGDDDDADDESFDHCSGGGFDFDAEGVWESSSRCCPRTGRTVISLPLPHPFTPSVRGMRTSCSKGPSFQGRSRTIWPWRAASPSWTQSSYPPWQVRRGVVAAGLRTAWAIRSRRPPRWAQTGRSRKGNATVWIISSGAHQITHGMRRRNPARPPWYVTFLWQRRGGPHSGSDTLSPGTDLLRGYCVILVGEFDHPNRGRRTAGKRKRRTNPETKESGYLTRGNVSILLQLCGTRVYNVPFTSSKQMKKGLTEGQLNEIEDATPLEADRNGPTLKDILQSCIEDRSSSEPRHLLVMLKGESDAMQCHWGKNFSARCPWRMRICL